MAVASDLSRADLGAVLKTALDAVVESGKIRAVGVSNFRPWDLSLLQSAMQTRLATNQIELSLLAHQGFTDGQVVSLPERGLQPRHKRRVFGGHMAAQPHVATGGEQAGGVLQVLHADGQAVQQGQGLTAHHLCFCLAGLGQ